MGAGHYKKLGLDYEGLLCLDTPCKTIKIIVGGIGTVYTFKNMVLTRNVDGVGWRWAQTMDTIDYTIW